MAIPIETASKPPGGQAVRVLSWLEQASLYFAALALAAITVMVTAAIVTRTFGLPLHFADEYGAYLMAASVFLALPAITAHREHLAAEFLVAMCGPRGKARLRVLSDLALLLFSLVLLAVGTRMTWVSYAQGLRSQGLMITPLYIPQAAMVAGFLLLVLSAALQVAVSIRNLRREDAAVKARP